MAVIQTKNNDFFSSILPLVGMLVPGAGPYVAGATLMRGLYGGNPQQTVAGAAGLAGGGAAKAAPVGSAITPDMQVGNMIGQSIYEDDSPHMRNWGNSYRGMRAPWR